MLLKEIKELRTKTDVAIQEYQSWMDCSVQGFISIVSPVSEGLDLVCQRP